MHQKHRQHVSWRPHPELVWSLNVQSYATSSMTGHRTKSPFLRLGPLPGFRRKLELQQLMHYFRSRRTKLYLKWKIKVNKKFVKKITWWNSQISWSWRSFQNHKSFNKFEMPTQFLQTLQSPLSRKIHFYHEQILASKYFFLNHRLYNRLLWKLKYFSSESLLYCSYLCLASWNINEKCGRIISRKKIQLNKNEIFCFPF